ncbi:MAG: hypothetical protein AAGE65_11705 [Planctomycetota bacterium]
MFARGLMVGVAVASIAGPGVWTASAEALRVVDASVFRPAGGDRVYFELELNRPPNWPAPSLGLPPAPSVANAAALPFESFQFLLDAATDDPLDTAFPWEVVVRGGEATETSGIPFRDATLREIDPDPLAGGWGPVLGVADYALDDATIAFSAPNAWIGASDRGVSYELLLLSDGQVVDRFIPTPTALAAGSALLVGGLLRRRTR